MSAPSARPILRRLAPTVAVALALVTAAPAAAQEDLTPEPLVLTPAQAEGPYYPVEIPTDHDADLTVVDGDEGTAAGQPLLLRGVVLDSAGQPVEGASVEIWQTDAFGVYLHPGDPGYANRDAAFQGFGTSETDADGAWAFRTILPELYGGRPRHIHAKVKVADETVLTTQIYFSGGDIPLEGSIPETDTELDALLVEVLAETDEDGNELLTAEHRLVVP